MNPDLVQRSVRRHHAGVLVADGSRAPVRFIIDPADGCLVAPLDPVALAAEDLVLHAPDEGAGRIELLLRAAEIQECAACDRWGAYHGRRDRPRWARLALVTARVEKQVLGADDLTLSSPLLAAESTLRRRCNRERIDALTDLCRRRLCVVGARPVVVGIDPWGIDIRLGHFVRRIELEPAALDADAARAAIDRLLDGGEA